MARCKGCIHDKVCNRDVGHGYSICPHYTNTTDVAPKSEVVKALNEVELLIIITKEAYKQQMEDAPNELSKQSKRTKWIAFEKFYERFAELKKKYTGEQT